MPHTLINEGNKETEELCKLVDAGVTDLSFKNGVYAAADVKKQLKIDQHGKCAYCERFLNGDYGAVEHFRPKGGYDCGRKYNYRQQQSEPEERREIFSLSG